MDAGEMVREARRRAGLTQAELAAAAGTTQSAIARLETGGTEPSFDRVTRLIRACGFDLVPRLAREDESDWSVASANLRLNPDARARQHGAALRFATAGRKALADAGG